MKYDKHTKLVESVMLLLYNLKPKDYVTYEDIIKNINTNKLELEKVLNNYEYSYLFETKCICSRKGQESSSEDMYLLSLEAERLIQKSNSWKGPINMSRNKPLKLQARYDIFRNIYSPTKFIIIAIYGVAVTLTTLWFSYKSYENEKRKMVDSLTIQKLTDSVTVKNKTIKKLRTTLNSKNPRLKGGM